MMRNIFYYPKKSIVMLVRNLLRYPFIVERVLIILNRFPRFKNYLKRRLRTLILQNQQSVSGNDQNFSAHQNSMKLSRSSQLMLSKLQQAILEKK